MKKIFTLLFFTGIVATSFAQYDHGQNDRNYNYAYNQRDHSDRGNFNPAKQRDFQIEKINRDFDYQVQAIQNDRYMRRHEKRIAIRNAEIERSRQLQLVDSQFSNFKNDHYRDDNRSDGNQRNW